MPHLSWISHFIVLTLLCNFLSGPCEIWEPPRVVWHFLLLLCNPSVCPLWLSAVFPVEIICRNRTVRYQNWPRNWGRCSWFHQCHCERTTVTSFYLLSSLLMSSLLKVKSMSSRQMLYSWQNINMLAYLPYRKQGLETEGFGSSYILDKDSMVKVNPLADRSISMFIKTGVLQGSLGSHIVPLTLSSLSASLRLFCPPRESCYILPKDNIDLATRAALKSVFRGSLQIHLTSLLVI